MEPIVEETTPENARKKKRQPEKWKVNVRKQLLYSAKTMPTSPTCSHRGIMTCSLLKMTDIRQFHAAFYANPTKQHQDTFLVKYVKKLVPKSTGKREITLHFYVENQVGNSLRVCRQTFIDILGITKHRVLGIYKNFRSNENSLVPKETRGGWRLERLFSSKRNSVINFITKLKGVESHYSREKSKRVYLPSELSTAKLWRMYNESVEVNLQVKESYFREIFNTKFNLSFSTPATDECSRCLELSYKIKMAKDEKEKEDLKLEKNLHKRKAKCFFEMLKEKPEKCLLLSFDCQKNLVLPKVSDQSAYYSRQLYCYNLTVVRGLSTGNLTPQNVSVYTWTENQSKKSSNEVASIVYNELRSTDVSDYTSVRLVADGCTAQNKNIQMLTMCGYWLATDAPKTIEKLELVFPITGHSYMPSDRVFGLIEKQLRKMKTIIDVSEYHEVFKQFGTMKEIGKDWRPYNWKEEAELYIKTPAQLHFKIMQSKRFILKRSLKGRILIKGEPGYNLDTGVFKALEKPGMNYSMVNPSRIEIVNAVNIKKAKDVEKLLKKHFGDSWEEMDHLSWYKDIIDKTLKKPDQSNSNAVVESQEGPVEDGEATGGDCDPVVEQCNDNNSDFDDEECEADEQCECLDPNYVEDEEIYCAARGVV